MCSVTFSAAYLKVFSTDPKLGFLSGADALVRTAGTVTDPVKGAEMIRQAAIWRFDAIVALGFVALVFLIVAGSVFEWYRLLRGTKRIVLNESEYVPLAQVEPSSV